MPRRSPSIARTVVLAVLLAAAIAPAMSGCSAAPEQPSGGSGERERLGLMTSLPLYWPLDAAFGDLAVGEADMPWQRAALEGAYVLEPLDTLSPIPALSPDAPDTDPLAGLDRLAVIQPRGLSPADNVALDGWVRAGGRLLLALDPALTGEYDLPLGDPRRPVDTALIPPVVARWGLAVRFDEAQELAVVRQALAEAALPLALAGEIAILDPSAADCTVLAGGAAARCAVGRGQVTLIADAAIFEHPELAGESAADLRAVVAEALR
ncbi:hypothetical protein CHX26_06995 [Porphyrobacter sp. HT-58-2]|uniref:hypothetical protein n=1 Tax=Porphyrobacter sp. HT-58-2 TaxID=2023229 RepID=UPI000CDC5CB7|nr:hypothetical protein [Porphyrobacter sp. HT-58-2]AUX69276.1 hypothetical protein CHX26_06995 [Porphyrobacter sp. HT-58-2]